MYQNGQRLNAYAILNLKVYDPQRFWLIASEGVSMNVYIQRNDRIVSKFKDRILQQIVYFESKYRILSAFGSYTFSQDR